MPTLALVAGYIVVIFIGALGALVLWKILNGTINLSHAIA